MPGKSEMLAAAYYRSQQHTQGGDIRLRDRLVELHIGLARQAAHRKAAVSPIPYEDLENLAIIGLSKAVQRYNPDRGAAFSSFAVPWIAGEMLRYERDNFDSGPNIPRTWVELYQRHNRARKRLEKANNDRVLKKLAPIPYTEESIAVGLGCTAVQWAEIKSAMERPPLLCFEELIAEVAPADGIAAQWAIAGDAVAGLAEPYRTCIVERYWRELSDQSIAQSYGWTEAEVAKWIEVAMGQLRSRLEQEMS